MELDGVPFFSQRLNQCGPASLATVLSFRDIAVTAESLEPVLYIPEREGTLAIEMQSQARQYGMLVYPVNNLQAIISELEAGNPVLVLQNLGLSWLPQWHYAVIIGFDLQHKTLMLRSGNSPRRQTSFRTFLNTWKRSDYWGRVILPPDRLPATAEPLAFLTAATELEQVGQTVSAHSALISALDHWPENTDIRNLATLGLSNIAYQQGNWGESKDWLMQSDLASSTSWNNLAYVMQKLQCPASAKSAIDCAITMAPENENLKASAQELDSLQDEQPDPPNRDSCDIPICPLLQNQSWVK